MNVKVRFKFTSIIIAFVIVGGAFAFLIGPSSFNVSASVTGDSYAAPFIDTNGNWLIKNNTVYDGTNVHVYHNIIITGASLTIRHATLTMDVASVNAHAVFVNNTGVAGTFKLAYANMTTSNSSAGVIWTTVYPQENAHVWVSNSTVSHTHMRSFASGNYFDNSTFHASTLLSIYDANKDGYNVSGNTFQDYEGYNIIGSSLEGTVISDNTFTNIAQTEDPAFNYRGLITVYGDGTTGNISIIKNHFDSVEVHAIKVTNAWNVVISRNTFDELTSTAEGTGTTIGISVWGDGKHAALTQYGVIDNNTFKDCEGDPDYYGVYGTVVSQDAKHWYVVDNSFWNLVKPDSGYESVGVVVSGGTVVSGTSYVYVLRNEFGNVTGTIDDAGGQSKAIAVLGTGSLNGPYTTTDVTIEDNTIDLVNQSALGIEIRYMVSDVIVSNNTITHLTGYDSSGIGIYNGPRTILVADNVITGMAHDVWGINLAHNHTYVTVARNTIHILDESTYHDEGEYAEVRGGGAIALDDEADAVYLEYENHWTGCGDVLTSNHITKAVSSDYCPSYALLNISYDDVGPYVRIVLTEATDIKSYNSTFTVEVPQGYVPVVVNNLGDVYPNVYEGEIWTAYVDGDDALGIIFINVTIEPWYSDTVVSLVGLTINMVMIGIIVTVIGSFVMPIVGGMKNKKTVPTEQIMKDAVRCVIFIVIGLVLWGMLRGIFIGG